MIVSHNPDTVRQLCTSVLWIHEGKVRMQGDVETMLEAYEGKEQGKINISDFYSGRIKEWL